MARKSLKSDLTDMITLCGVQSLAEPEDAIMEDEELQSSLVLLESNRYMAPRSLKRVFVKQQWWQVSLFNADFNEEIFRSAFRMDRSTFWVLYKTIEEHGNFTEEQEPGYLQLAVALYRFGMYGNAASLLQVASKFDIGHGTVSAYTERIIEALTAMSTHYIRWPDPEERKRHGDQMAVKLFPKCIGFVDGTDVIFSQAPLDNKDAYWSRKKHYCMQLQIVCNADKRILDLFTGYPGSVHDAKVFNSSPLGVHPEKYFTDGEFLIGDSAYTLTETVTVPFCRCPTGLTNMQKKYNKHLSGERVKVEHAIGLLKGRFKSLKDLRLQISSKAGHRRACKWIHACAILHNFLLDKDEWEEFTPEQSQLEEIDLDAEILIQPTKKGFYKRQALLEIFTAMN